MASTRRQVNQILANLPDNITQEISAEDIRDSFVSAIPQFVSGHIAPGDLPVTINVPDGNWNNLTGLLPALVTTSDDFSGSQYTGNPDVGVFGMLVISIAGSSQREAYEFRATVNGVVDDGSVVQMSVGSSGANNIGQVTIPLHFAMQSGQTLGVDYRQLTGVNDFDILAYSVWLMTRVQP